MPRYVRGIVVQASMDRMGCITVRPKSDKWALKFARHLHEMHNGTLPVEDYLDVFLQGSNVDEFIEHDVPRRYRRDLQEGWTVRWVVDPWVVGHWYGWDAHTVAE